MSDIVKVGIVGVGRLGFRHAENIATTPGAQLVAVCSRTQARAMDAAKKLGVTEVYTDFEEMVKNADIDAVVIANTSTEHCKCIQIACKAKKHIWCEKPTGINTQELDLIDEAVASNKGKVFQVGFMRRYDVHYAAAKKKVDEGSLGDVIKMRIISRDPVIHREFFTQYAPTSGGLLMDMASHDVDLARWFSGSEPKTIYAMGGVYVIDEFKSFGDVDNAMAVLQFENGVMVEIENSRTATCGYDLWMGL